MLQSVEALSFGHRHDSPNWSRSNKVTRTGLLVHMVTGSIVDMAVRRLRDLFNEELGHSFGAMGDGRGRWKAELAKSVEDPVVDAQAGSRSPQTAGRSSRRQGEALLHKGLHQESYITGVRCSIHALTRRSLLFLSQLCLRREPTSYRLSLS